MTIRVFPSRQVSNNKSGKTTYYSSSTAKLHVWSSGFSSAAVSK